MNYHLMVDDKFFDSLIEDMEKISAPGTNRYFIRASKENGIHVKHLKAEWFEDFYGTQFREILNRITFNDKIFVHWYDLYVGELMLTIDQSIPLFVSIMGGDFYQDPSLYHRHWLYDRKTLKIFNKNFVYPKVWARRPIIFLKQVWKLATLKAAVQKQFELKRKTVQRINYLLAGKFMDDEVRLVKELYKVDGMLHLPFIFDQNFDLALSLPAEIKKSKVMNIQIGNSATYANNHLDLLDILGKFSEQNVLLSLPLSYGDPDYARIVKENYGNVFDSKAEFLEAFMARKEYVSQLQKVDICIMYHNRSQALGNCITLLTLGKKLYLKRNNPLWSLFQKIGVVVFDTELIKTIPYEEFVKPLSADEIKSNLKSLLDTFSEKERLENLRQLLN